MRANLLQFISSWLPTRTIAVICMKQAHLQGASAAVSHWLEVCGLKQSLHQEKSTTAHMLLQGKAGPRSVCRRAARVA